MSWIWDHPARGEITFGDRQVVVVRHLLTSGRTRGLAQRPRLSARGRTLRRGGERAASRRMCDWLRGRLLAPRLNAPTDRNEILVRRRRAPRAGVPPIRRSPPRHSAARGAPARGRRPAGSGSCLRSRPVHPTGTSSRTSVPPSGRVSRLRWAPIRMVRSRMPRMPAPSAEPSRPRPLSAMRSSTPSRSRASASSTRDAPASRDVGQAFLGDPVQLVGLITIERLLAAPPNAVAGVIADLDPAGFQNSAIGVDRRFKLHVRMWTRCWPHSTLPRRRPSRSRCGEHDHSPWLQVPRMSRLLTSAFSVAD
jgi:hypothetical protein